MFVFSPRRSLSPTVQKWLEPVHRQIGTVGRDLWPSSATAESSVEEPQPLDSLAGEPMAFLWMRSCTIFIVGTRVGPLPPAGWRKVAGGLCLGGSPGPLPAGTGCQRRIHRRHPPCERRRDGGPAVRPSPRPDGRGSKTRNVKGCGLSKAGL